MAITTILGAALLVTLDMIETEVEVRWDHIIGGFVLAAVSAFLIFRFFMQLVARTGMMPCVVHRLMLGTELLMSFV